MEDLLPINTHAPVNWNFMNWAIVTTAPARSVAHFDAGRCATWLEVVTGTKAFWIRRGTANAITEPCATDPTKYEWFPVVLQAGHML
jgi:hypothetical protein